jgi:hypothetical protein
MHRIAMSLVVAALFTAPVRAGTLDPEGAQELPAYSVADPGAPEVTEANLLASERFWPYQAALLSSGAPTGAKHALAAGALGVVIRAEAGARVRLDFGRDGLVTLPVRDTDLLGRANAIRSGVVTKTAPNLTFAIAPRLLDAEAEAPRRVRLEASMERSGFLCLFADPSAPGFARLAASLAPLGGRGVLPVLFPQGEHPDAALLPKLRAAGWRGAFALDHMSEAYTRTLLDDGAHLPLLALYSAEGRELWSGAVGAAIPPELERALADGFAPQH